MPESSPEKLSRVDARGLSCPQPALMARRAIAAAEGGAVEVLVDNPTARDNVTRVARQAGWNAQVESLEGGEFRLLIRK